MKRFIFKAVSSSGQLAMAGDECNGLRPGLLIWQGNPVIDVSVDLTPEGRPGSQMESISHWSKYHCLYYR